MITSQAKVVIINNVSRMFPYIERRDIEQEYVCWEHTKYGRTKLGMRGKLIDWFSSRRWQDSDEGKVVHVSYEKLVEAEKTMNSLQLRPCRELKECSVWIQPPMVESPEDEYGTTVQIQELLDTLNEQDSEIFYLRFWEGLTLVEVAERVGLKKSCVAVRISKRLAKWRKRLVV